jgi:hypothetical protein
LCYWDELGGKYTHGKELLVSTFNFNLKFNQLLCYIKNTEQNKGKSKHLFEMQKQWKPLSVITDNVII